MIGGGYIGMETAAGLNKNGLDVTVVFPEKHLMERLFTPEVAQFYEKYYQDKGVTLKPGSLATEFKGENGVVSILSSYRLPSQTRLTAQGEGWLAVKQFYKYCQDKGGTVKPGSLAIELRQRRVGG